MTVRGAIVDAAVRRFEAWSPPPRSSIGGVRERSPCCASAGTRRRALPAPPKSWAAGRPLDVRTRDDHQSTGLRKAYAGQDAVRGISVDVARGEVFGFLGLNGAGKTTTIEILEGYRA